MEAATEISGRSPNLFGKVRPSQEGTGEEDRRALDDFLVPALGGYRCLQRTNLRSGEQSLSEASERGSGARFEMSQGRGLNRYRMFTSSNPSNVLEKSHTLHQQ